MFKRFTLTLLAVLSVASFATMGVGVSAAAAAEPWWHLALGSAPATIEPEGTGELVVTASNLGDADARGCSKVVAGAGKYKDSGCTEAAGSEPNEREYEKTPVRIVDKLPPGLKALSIGAVVNLEDGGNGSPVPCSLSPSKEEGTCTFAGTLPPYDQIEVRIPVEVEESVAVGAVNEASVSGGGASVLSSSRPLAISTAPLKFGVENYEMSVEEEGGAPDTQTGSHPFQLTTTTALNQSSEPASPPALAKDLHFNTPPGLVGNPTVFPQCREALFLRTNEDREGSDYCPADTALGIAAVKVIIPNVGNEVANFVVPLFNLSPERGEPARFGFFFDEIPVFLDTSIRTGEGYAVRVSVDNITESVIFVSSRVTFWGVPGAPSHDSSRGWECVADGHFSVTKPGRCSSGEESPPPFLALPTSCTGGLETTMEADSWQDEGAFTTFGQNPSAALPALDGCNQLPFKPTIKVSPDVQEASKPSGLNIDVHVPQQVDLDSEGLSASDVKNIVVTLPEGLILNPSAADGLSACPLLKGKNPVQEEREGKGELDGINLETPQPANCPNSSKIANVTIHSPLLPTPLEGFVYLAAPQNFSTLRGFPQENQFEKHVAQYLVAEDKEAGVLVKLPGSVELGGEPGVTGLQPGQIRSTFADQPQLPFEDAELHFFGGERAPLATPSHCGSYTTNASYAPWSGNGPTLAEGQFAINTGPNDSACPGSALPFNATLASGSTNNNAGSFSELTTTLSRPDGNQNIQSVTLHYPPGLTGLLAGVELCPEGQANAGTCGPNSQIGETIVSVGVGGDPFTVTGGKAYITGPYEGAPFGLSIVNPAKAGPFDLQEGRPVVVRAKVEVNPTTAALTVTTNTPAQGYAIPTIIEGFPLQIQHVNVLVNRPGFTVNPTNCNKMEITSTIDSAEGSSAAVSDPFQVTNCAAMKFTPKFTVSTNGKASKADGADLVTKVTEPNEPQGSQADITKVKVELPLQLPSRLTTLQKACLAKVFEANPAACPPASFIGHAVVHTPLLPVPLEGPAIFVSHGGEAFPSLTMALQGYGVTIDLVGTTFISKAGITSTTFNTVPDQPFSSFELVLPQGPYSALGTNLPHESHDLCGQKLIMPTEFIGQNGAELRQDTPITVEGCAPAITVVSHKVKGKTATIQVSVPGAGKLVATGKGLSKASKTATGTTTLSVKLTLTNGEAAALSKHKGRKLKAKINLTFTPKKGKTLKTSTTVIVG